MKLGILYLVGINEVYLKFAPKADILIQEWKSSDAFSLGKGHWYANFIRTAVEEVILVIPVSVPIFIQYYFLLMDFAHEILRFLKSVKKFFQWVLIYYFHLLLQRSNKLHQLEGSLKMFF